MKQDYTGNHNIIPDLTVARQFLSLLDKNGSKFTFEVIEEPKPKDRKAKIQRYHGTLEQYQKILINANQNGYGVFVAVNATNGAGRRKEDIERIRALFVDLDGSPIATVYDAPLKAHIIVESSPGRFHGYWIVDGVPLEQFESAQKKLAQRFKGDPSVCDLPRLMRLPGFVHRKEAPFQSRILDASGINPYSLQEFQDAFGLAVSAQHKDQAPSVHESQVLVRLREHQLLRKEEPLVEGRWKIKCPWSHEHTDGDDNAYYYPKPSKKYPREGFHCFHTHCKYRDIRALRSFLNLTPLEGVEPLPLFREVHPPAPYPVEALGPILGRAAEELHDTVKAPMAVIAQSLLGAASLLTQGHANVETEDGRCVALSLFLITVAESGERKSAVDDIVLSTILDWQENLMNTHRKEMQEYQDKLDVWMEKKRKALARDKSFHLPELEQGPERPITPLIIVEEPTYEGLVKHLEYGHPSTGIFSDEGGRFLGGNAMSKENMLKTLAGLSSLWDAKKGKPITRIRSVDKTLALYGRRCALHLMIQESVYGKLSENSLCDTQGFLPRCLVSFPESMVGKRTYVNSNPRKLPGVQAFGEHCKVLLSLPYPSAPPPAPKNQLNPASIPLSREGHRLYVEFHDSREKRFGKFEDYHGIRRFGSKAAEHVLRVAGVMALFEDSSTKEISTDHIKRAIIIIDYYLGERLRLDNYYCVEPSLLTAQKVLDWAQARGKKGVRLSDLYQYGPPEVRSKDRAIAILLKLEEHGRAYPVPACEIEEGTTGKAWKFV